MAMPRRAKKPCNYPGCPELVTAGQRYCDTHTKKAEKQRQARYDKYQRDKQSAKFHSSRAWQKTRNRKLKLNPLCEYCLPDNITPATEVDHIIPIKVDWSFRLVMSNLKSSCHACHMRKTAEDRKKYGGG